METRILSIDGQNPDPVVMASAAELIRAGQLVAFPTETVYGLGANALDPEAVARIFEAKGRPAGDPLIVHISSLDQLPLLSPMPVEALAPVLHHWPGPLTLIVPRSAAVPLSVTSGLETVAVRMPAHPVARALIDAAGVPIAAPSANRFTRPSPTCAEHVRQDLEGRIPLLLDGGETWHGLESTVVDMSCNPPALLRPGALTVEVLLESLPALQVPAALTAAGEHTVLKSPGTHLKHYAPKARVLLFSGSDAGMGQAVRAALESHRAQGARVGILGCEEHLEGLRSVGVELISLGSRSALKQAGQRLFAALRDLDEAGVEVILAFDFPPAHLGRTLHDRLVRAAAGEVIRVD